MSIISYEDEGENIKENADKQPYNWMVDEKYYKTNCCNNSYKIETESNYLKAFVVYRLAHDKFLDYHSQEYQKYNKLIENK